MSVRKRVGIIQSNYIPWKGYFDFIDSVDHFVLLDDVQFTRRDWRNRNRIKTKDGLQWLTIPVDVKGKYHQSIAETRISSGSWGAEHAAALRHAYARAPHFREEWAAVEPVYARCASLDRLAPVNRAFIEHAMSRLDIRTPISSSLDFDLTPGKNERLIGICTQLGATEYLSGPAAQEYMDEAAWNAAGIDVKYKSYGGYPEYPQMHAGFEHFVSVLDLLFNAGPDARRYVKSAAEVA